MDSWVAHNSHSDYLFFTYLTKINRFFSTPKEIQSKQKTAKKQKIFIYMRNKYVHIDYYWDLKKSHYNGQII